MGPLRSVIFILFINNFFNDCFALNDTQRVSEDSGTIVSEGSEGVSLTQHATCHISSEDLVANAEATVTRVLTGVCTSEVVDARFENLETMIKRELGEIKETLNSLVGCKQSTVIPTVDPRQEEIDRLNNSVNTVNTRTGVEKTFNYFVRVEDFDQKSSRWESGRFERSPTFYLPMRRYAMYLKVTPRDVHGEMTYVKIGAGLTRGVYDETLEWPFPLKHQVEILDHSTQEFPRDLRASIVNPPTSGSPDYWAKPSSLGSGENREQTVMAIPASFLLANTRPNSIPVENIAKYIWNGDLIIKLTVYLDQTSK